MTEFRPDLTPEQMERLGVLAGRYDSRDPKEANFFRVEASQKVWPNSWKHESAPMGWFEWYKGYHAGVRTEDDERQIKRWASFKARHLAQLKKADPGLDNLEVQKKRRQAMLHWALSPGIDIDKTLEKGNVNAYLEKASALRDNQDKKEGHLGKKVVAFGAASVIPTAVFGPLTAPLASSAVGDFAKDGVSDHVLEGFKSHVGMGHVPHVRTDYPGVGAAFDHVNNVVHSSSNLSALHEFGHASNFNSVGKNHRVLKQIGYGLGAKGMGSLVGMGVALSGEPSDKKTAIGTAIAAGSYLPMLHEEATASWKPVKYLAEKGLHAEHALARKAFSKAFGTYGLTAAAGISAPLLAGKIFKHLKGKDSTSEGV